nr:hypothetical protein [uncultured Methanoregula sp.]
MNAREWIDLGAGMIIAVMLAGCMILGFGLLGIPGHFSPSLEPAPVIPRSNAVVLDTALPASPASVPVYHITDVHRFSFGSPATLVVKKSIPSTAEAPGLAVKALGTYGGLPGDAALEQTEQVFLKKYNLKTDMVEEQYPQYTRVAYRQSINGSPVVGSGIDVLLGENGDALEISKHWPAFARAGEVPVISAEEALEKLNAGNLLIRPQCCTGGMHVSAIRLGYYVETHLPDASAQPPLPSTCTPVWIFYATRPGTPTEPFPLMVNATRDEL